MTNSTFIKSIAITSALLTTACQTTISGTIVDEDGQPVFRDAKVNITHLNPTKESQSTILNVNQSGAFVTSEPLEEGEYLVEPLIPGYQYGSTKLILNEDKEVNFTVKKIDPYSSNQLKANDRVILGHGTGNTTITPPKF